MFAAPTPREGLWCVRTDDVARAALIRGNHMSKKLTAEYALVQLFECGDFPDHAVDPNRAAQAVVRWLADSGFKIVDANVWWAKSP